MGKPKKSFEKKVTKLWAKHRNWRKLFIVAIYLGAAFIIWLAGMFIFGIIYQHQHRNDKVIIGTSFTKETANDLGVDWKANFTALLEDMGIRNYRLMSYWKDIESERGKYNFEDLDWQFAEAEKYNAKISLSVGLRQPRWPECHQAQWAWDLYAQDYPAWEAELYDFISAVVDRYKTSPALESWHLENEYFNRNFGNCENYSKKRLQDEVDLIKKHDPDHPVVITLADQLGFPLFGTKSDIFATSLYRGNHVKIIGYVPYPIPTHFYSAKSFFIDLLRDRDVYIHELQLEPWGAKPTRELTVAEQDKLMGYDQIVGNIRFGLQTGMKKMYLWGSEWWYWRKVNFNDPSVWNTVKDTVQRAKTNEL